MELPATVSFGATFFLTPRSPGTSATTSAVLAVVWLVHYGNRGWYFPLSIRVAPGSKTSFGGPNATHTTYLVFYHHVQV